MRGWRAMVFVAAGCVAATGVGALGVGAAPAQEQTGAVTLVHAVRGLVADVYLDGSVVLETFQPERTTDPLPLPAGQHTVELRSAGSAPDSEPLLSSTLTVVAGTNVSAAVHLTADGAPALTVFTDDVTPTPAGQGRVRVRHVAAAGAIDVQLGTETVGAGTTNGQEAGGELAAGTYPATVTSGGQELLPPADVALTTGTLTALYLIGSAADDSLAWLIDPIPTTAVAPQVINSGSDGLVAPDPFPTGVVAVLAVLAVGAAIAIVRTRAACRASTR